MNNEEKFKVFGYLVGPVMVLVLFAFFSSPRCQRYQVARHDKNRAIVIDTQTGEAWTTEKFIDREYAETCLSPINYYPCQNDDWTYKPNERRNKKNTTWGVLIRRLFSSKKGAVHGKGKWSL